jgi:hypothetical protein
MTTMKNIKILFIAMAVLAGIHQAAAQGTTAFTYQGQLHDSGTNANGAYTMIFALYDAGTNGNQIGSSIITSATLANGLFSVNLDFGASAFDGSARWLDITVTNGGTTETLSPRVQLLPVPYAQFAGVAATVTNGAITTAQIAGGQVVRTLNGLTDNVLLAAGANTLVFTNGNTLQFSAGALTIQKFTSSGTFVVPTNVAKIMVEAWGGGGGGGACNSATNSAGGGGAGAYTLKTCMYILARVTPSPSAAAAARAVPGATAALILYSASAAGLLVAMAAMLLPGPAESAEMVARERRDNPGFSSTQTSAATGPMQFAVATADGAISLTRMPRPRAAGAVAACSGTKVVPAVRALRGNCLFITEPCYDFL